MSDKKEKIKDEIVFGLFWQVAPDNTISIFHEGLNKFLADRGFYYERIDNTKRLCRRQGKIREECDITDVSRFVYDFINSASVPDVLAYSARKKELLNLFVRGIDNYINYPKLRLLPNLGLPEHMDSSTHCFFYLSNCVVCITKDTITTDGYVALDGYVWKKKIKPHPFTLLSADEPEGIFETFCFRVCNQDIKRFESLKSIIGYLLHRHWFARMPIIPCFLDEASLGLEEANGRSGKSLICKALKYVRNVVDLDGKSFNPEGSFAFQRVGLDTDILVVDDLSRKVSFESWFSIVTMGIEINQKNKPAFKIPPEKLFKIVLNSNFPIRTIYGRSSEKRKLEFECSSYYGELSPFDEFKHEFFTDWDDAEFNRMFNFFARCVQAYLKGGLITPPSVNYAKRQLISAIGADLIEYLDNVFSDQSKVQYHKKDLYDEFLRSYPGQRNFYPSPNKFSLKVHRYLDYHKVQFMETPANKKTVLEILDWGEMPITDDMTEPILTQEHKTLSDTPHNYEVVATTQAPKPAPVKGGQEMSFADAMKSLQNEAKPDADATTPGETK